MIYLFRFRPTSMGSVYEKISRRKYGDNKVWMAGPHQVGNQELERKKNWFRFVPDRTVGIFHPSMQTDTITPPVPPWVKFRPISGYSGHSDQFRAVLDFGLKKKKKILPFSSFYSFWLRTFFFFLLLLLLLLLWVSNPSSSLLFFFW